MLEHNPKVFISYSHDSDEPKDRVLALSDRLRADGIDCIIDQYETSPSEGWARWCNNQIETVEFVLVVCTNTYEQRFKGTDITGKGKGVKWEGATITQELYEAQARNKKFIPVIFTSEDETHIPIILRGATYYIPNTKKGYESLYCHLTNQPFIEKPVLGKLKSMPPRPRKEDFCAPPWNAPFQRNPYFTGREQVLEQLHNALISNKAAALAQAISGLGGIGKTQTAVEYAYRYRKEYNAVLWVKAYSLEALISDYAALAHVLDLHEKDEKEQNRIMVEAYPKSCGTERMVEVAGTKVAGTLPILWNER
ncbi:MAG: SEFIR domain-containing protein [Candidatus Methanoperedens sp.]